MEDEDDLLWERDMDGESLVKRFLYDSDSGYSIYIIDDNTHERFYWGHIDKSKKYHVRVIEVNRFGWDYTKLVYYIKEIN